MSDLQPQPSSCNQDISRSRPPAASREASTRSVLSRPSTTTSTHPPPTPSTPATQLSGQNYFKVPPSPSPAGMSTGGSAAKQAKVAIPRLKRSLETQEGASKAGGRHRVTHACEPCRHRKTKCSGERPACRHCQDFKIACYYADGKRDRVKKQFGSMSEKVTDYEKILRDLVDRVSDSDAKLIRKTLEKAAMLDMDDNLADTNTIQSVEPDGEEYESGAESEVSAGAGSTGAVDRTREDFTREGAKQTGFMGKNSEITWIQKLQEENKRPKSPQQDELNHANETSRSARGSRDAGTDSKDFEAGMPVNEASYHLDDLAITTFDAIDPYELPTQETAEMLFNTYFLRVYPGFPVLGKVNLQNQFQKFLSRPTMRPPPKWLAILNLVFAISAKYSHLVQADWQADERDHLIYFSRARILAIDDDTLFNHPDLQQIQILGLMSFYLMCISQINRSWTLAGIAIRYAVALGLNMRNDGSELADPLKEIRYRMWWALYTLEHRLCSMTGRVNCILDEHCTTPLPVPVLEEEFETETGKNVLNKESQMGVRAPLKTNHTPSGTSTTPSSDRSASRSASKPSASRSPSGPQNQTHELEWAADATPNSSLYFLQLVQLCRVTQDIFQRLYNPSTIQGTWSDVQTMISTMNAKLDSWYRNLPSIFDFRRKQRDRDCYEFRLGLGFYYYAAKQMLHRPCLCRLDRKIPNQSNKSNEFNHSAATTCVTAAQDLLSLIPDETNAVGLIRVGPWTNIVHLLVQSAAVLMLEISFRAHHMPEQADNILESSKKAVRWLHALGEDNLAAARAWRLCNRLLIQAATKIGRDVKDMPDKPPRTSPSVDNSMSEASSHLYSSAFIPTTTIASSGFAGPGYNFATSFDPLMHYDQYHLDSNLNMNPQMHQFQDSGQGSMQFGNAPNEAEMQYMNSIYHNAQQQQDRSGSMGDGSGGSGYV